ncbi:MAG: amidase domain-containing protein [Anaerolineaceae bacterium]|nr:amidase domain-containing protein [Anaerolineaceae bacterium]
MNMHSSKLTFNIFAVLGLLLTPFSLASTNREQAIGFTHDQEVISHSLKTRVNPWITDEDKIKAVINSYFYLRYEGQKQLKEQDYSSLLADKTQKWVQEEEDKREIEFYVASIFKLNYVDYKYALDYDSIEIISNIATVHLRENHEVIFEAIAPEVSKLANLEHVITLRKSSYRWAIVSDEYQDEVTRMMTAETKESILKRVRLNYEDDLHRAIVIEGGKNTHKSPYTTDYLYDRTLAVNYADSYWDSTGPHYRRDPSGNDCTNFVSQSIYAGQSKSPPDTDGMGSPSSDPISWEYGHNWYYRFDSGSSSTPLNQSASYAWINVGGQNNFIQTGYTTGPFGYETNICTIRDGDVIQYKVNGYWSHEGMLVQIIGPCTSLSNFLIDAHTSDRYHYPLSYWSSFELNYLVIDGWRG